MQKVIRLRTPIAPNSNQQNASSKGEKHLSIDCLIKQFKLSYNQLLHDKLILAQDIRDYYEGCGISLHSQLQYGLIKAGIECGFTPIPEYRISLGSRIVRLNEPIDKKKLGIEGETRRQNTIKTDIAFIKPMGYNPKIMGIAEVTTLDEINHCEHSNDLVTQRDKLKHLIKQSNPRINFVLLLSVFPDDPVLFKRGRNRDKQKLPWGQNNHTVQFWEKKWRELTDELKKEGTDARLISLREKQVDQYP